MKNPESQNSKKEAVDWYRGNRSTYEQLSMKVESIIKENLHDIGIHIHSIQNRTKEIDSFSKKIEDTKYSDPIFQIQDLSGIRIITYVESDLEKISDFVQKNFEIDPDNSSDKSKSLGTDKVGYRSIHFVARLSSERLVLPEYKKFEKCCFEIQIRTILQHAWAEIEHDRGYKFSGELPQHLKRRFKVLAGVLELADREFDQIAKEIDIYGNQVVVKTQQGNLEIPLDSTSLRSFISVTFTEIFNATTISDFDSPKIEKMILDELTNFGIATLKDLKDIIPPDFQSVYLKFKGGNMPNNSFIGFLRDIMLCFDAYKYFEISWNGNWSLVEIDTLAVVEYYCPDIRIILGRNGIVIYSDD